MYYSSSLFPVYRLRLRTGRRYLFDLDDYLRRQISLPLKSVAVLFASKRSYYSRLDLVDIWDEQRDARNFAFDLPVVAYPPCRGWGRLRQFAKIKPHELDLAFFAVDAVRRCGGVLEHPTHSTLWNAAGLPLPGVRDEFGGFTLPVFQSWFGHRAPKPTWLYIVGHDMDTLPALPFSLGIPPWRIENMATAERESTPIELANWLCQVAQTSRIQSCSASTTATKSHT